MIDLKQELQYYTQLDLEKLEAEGVDLPSNIKNSVVLYNKALESLNIGSEDIAVIELKKAVSLNPDFYEAMNLLGVCYSYLNEQEKASEVFKRVVNAETNGVRALSYLNRVNSQDNPDMPSTSKRKRNTIIKSRINRNKDKHKDKYKDSDQLKILITSFIAGIIITLLIVLPISSAKSSKNLRSAENENNDLKSQIELLDKKYDSLITENEKIEEQLDFANSKVDYYKFSLKLFEAQELIGNKEYEEAADMLILLKTFTFLDDERIKFDQMYKNVMPLAANSSYDSGFKQYNNRKYKEAIAKLEKVKLYDEDNPKVDAAFYYIGRSYKELNDSRNAIAMFQHILDEFPNSYYYKYATYRINELTQIP